MFQPDGHLLLFEQEILVEWPTDTPTLKRYACRIAGRDLTRQERNQLLPEPAVPESLSELDARLQGLK